MKDIRLADRIIDLTLLIAGIGYTIDMYDMFLFNMVRVRSLADLGLTGGALTSAGLFVSSAQMAGLVAGAILWGMVADKAGRKIGLFASILVYSLGSLACAFVQDVNVYAVLRFITGVGIAGEIGSGIALVSERLAADKRGMGIMIFISLGLCGVLLAGIGAEFMEWRHMYMLGGVAGLLILFARTFLKESPLFADMAKQKVLQGGFMPIVRNAAYLKKYIAGILLMVPPVFAAQILWTLSPEIGLAMGLDEPVKANVVLAVAYAALIFGDFAAAYLSEKLQSRKKASVVFLTFGTATFAYYMLHGKPSMGEFYVLQGMLGFFLSFWVVASVWIAEQFGTNIRATVSTTTPNFARAMAIPMNMAFGALKVSGAGYAVSVIGAIVFALAYAALALMPETYGRNLDFVDIV